MHGRLRVKTTAQQEAEKAVERQKKLAKYNAGTQLLFKKRGERVYDEETALQLSQILAVNPDFYTLWNYRRQIFLHWQKEKSEDYMQTMLKSDLQFTEQCLGVNPKSYCAWHHRCWVMEHMPSPDWQTEIILCDRYLKLDGRNFHCWDYRRFAVAGAGREAAAELVTTDRLIETNFSNYSSWHYRSQLLVELYPPGGDVAAPVREDKYHAELALVQNAVFTDPDDQSAWFYHRWLLQPRHPAANIVTCVSTAHGEMARVVVVLATASSPQRVGLTLVGGQDAVKEWSSPTGEDIDMVWVAETRGEPAALSVEVTDSEGLVRERAPCAGDVTGRFVSEISAATADQLKEELVNLEQLREMEPDNKWVLLSMMALMWAMDPRVHQQEILALIEDLTKLDQLRRGYYSDLSRSPVK